MSRNNLEEAAISIDSSLEIDSLLARAWELLLTDLEQMRSLAWEAGELSKAAGYQNGIAESLLLIGRYKGGMDQYGDAIEYSTAAHQMFIDNVSIIGQVKACRVLGYIYSRNGQFDKSLDHFFRGVKLLTENDCQVMEGPYPISAFLYNNIAYIYAETGRSVEALNYFFKAYELTKVCKGTMAATVLINIAETELDLGETELALRYCKMALTELHSMGYSHLDMHNCYNAFGLIYKMMGQYDLALDSFHSSMESALLAGSKYSQIVSCLDIARLYLLLKEAGKALETIDNGMPLAVEIKAQVLLRDLNLVKAQACEELGDFHKALDHYKQYMEISSEVYSRDMERQISNYESEFKIEQAKKDAEIYRLRNIELKQKSLEIEQKALLLEQSNRNITIISEIGQRITATLDLEDVLNTIYLNVNQLMDASAFAIGLYDQQVNIVDFRIYIENGIRLGQFGIDIEKKKGFVSACIEQGIVIVDNDVVFEEKKNLLVTNGIKPRSVVFCPLKFAGKVTGVVTVQSYNPEAYSANNVETIKALASYIAIALNNSQQSEALKITAQELELLSKIDPLTGLYIRRHIIEKMEEEFLRFLRYGKKFSLMIIDIDFFKRINDAYGHNCGDIVLIALSEQMKSMLRQQDCLARWGGEEFLILLPETEASKAVVLAERLRSNIEQKVFEYRNVIINLTMTFGIAESGGESTVDDIIMKADDALYEGKRKGRNRVECYTEPTEITE
jgi:diguanylate cyclase (GGDEF)-like protein